MNYNLKYLHHGNCNDVVSTSLQVNVTKPLIDELIQPAEVAMSEQYGIIGSATTLLCVGISAGEYKPQLSIYQGETLLFKNEDPDLLAVSIPA